jgi:hypothetical protein
MLSENRKAPHYVFFSSLLLPMQQYRKITKMAVQSAAVLLAVRNVKCGPVPDIPMRVSWFSLVPPSTIRSASHFFCVPPCLCFLIVLLLGAIHCRCGGVAPLVLHIDTGRNEWSVSFPSWSLCPLWEHLWHPFEYKNRWAPHSVCIFSIAETSLGCTGDGSPNRPAYRLVTIPTELSRIPTESCKK